MKYFLVPLFLVIFVSIQAQDRREVWYDGETRSYLIHVPDGYNGESGLPLVINLHGFGSTATEQLIYSRFNTFADLNNFIVVYPMGVEATIPIGTGNHWNAGFDTGVDDIGFINRIIDLIWNEYQVNLSKVYATGMSNGGFMSYTLACELSDRIAAIASVTGSMTILQEQSCKGEYIVPVMQFHGTVDPVVPFEGRPGQYPSIPDLMDFWAERHGCLTETIEENLPDERESDGSTVTLVTYQECDDVILYRINNGGHTWPGGAIDLPEAGNTNRDINASSLIWEFFSTYEHPNPSPGRVITSVEPVASQGRIFPTKFDSHLVLRDLNGARVTLMDQSGRVWKEENIQSDLKTWNMNTLASGLYLVRYQFDNRPPKIVKVIKL